MAGCLRGPACRPSSWSGLRSRWFAAAGKRDEAGQRATLEKTESYTRLRVHREGRAIYSEVDDKINNAFSLLTVLSLPYLLDHLAPRLAATVDGDPATTTDEPE